MGRAEKTVFLSYRRSNVPWALAIFQNLTQYGYDVFFDFEGIGSGDFESVILENIKSRAHFLIVLTPSALERCSNPEDWLRREIETAVETKRNIVPLMLEGFDFGSPGIANQLTGRLEVVKHYNALPVPSAYFLAAMERLRDKFLSVSLEAVPHPASNIAQRAALIQQEAAGAAPLVDEKELTAQEYFERGFETSDLDEKVRFYSQAIRLNPDFAIAHCFRGDTYRQKGELKAALMDLNVAILLKPSKAHYFSTRARIQEANGDLERANKDYDEAIRLRPDYALNISFRGDLYKKKGNLKAALKDFNQAIRLEPKDPYHFVRRGRCYEAKGDIEDAIRDYSDAIRVDPDYALAFSFRGDLLVKKGDLEGALNDFNEAIRAAPEDSYHFMRRGRFSDSTGDIEDAIHYDEAIRLKPESARFFGLRSEARRALGDAEGALHDHNEAIRLESGHAGVQ